jgi:hypothetical protein
MARRQYFSDHGDDQRGPSPVPRAQPADQEVDSSHLSPQVLDGSGSEDQLLPGKASVRPNLRVRNKGCCAAYTASGCAAGISCCCYNATDDAHILLTGDWGTSLPPSVSRFEGNDPDDGDDVYGASDSLLVQFTMATDRANGDPFGGKAWVDDLLWFSFPPGDDYSGEWVSEDSALRISIISPPTTLSTLPELSRACHLHPDLADCYENVPPAVPLNVTGSTMIVSPRGDSFDFDGDGNVGDLRNRAGSSVIAGTPPIVNGDIGSLVAPRITSFVVDDPDNADTTFGLGDRIRVTFGDPSEPRTATSRPHYFSRQRQRPPEHPSSYGRGVLVSTLPPYGRSSRGQYLHGGGRRQARRRQNSFLLQRAGRLPRSLGWQFFKNLRADGDLCRWWWR